VGAEIRRLKTLYPAWNPPADLFVPKSDVNEQPLWDLYAAGRFEEVRVQIAALKASSPSYRPSADLTTKLDDADIRRRIQTSSDTDDWGATLAAARERPSLLVCGEMDILWRVGEAFTKSGDLARAFDLYSYVLTHCTKPAERLATIQKAALLLPQKGIDALISYGETVADGVGEFDSLRFQKLRAEIGDAIASDRKRSIINVKELSAFEKFVKSERTAPDASLLGWYNYNIARFERAKDWFNLASDIGSDPKYLEGYILSLRNLDDLEASEDVAYRNWDQSPEIAKIYVELVADRMNEADKPGTISKTDLDRFGTVVAETQSALGAQTLGWYLLEDEKTIDAGAWFQKSVDWQATEEGVVGLAVVANRTKNNKSLKAIKAEYGETFAAVADFQEYSPPARQASYKPRTSRAAKPNKTRRARSGKGDGGGDKLMRQANQQFQAGDYQAALATLDRRQARSGKSYGAEVLRGWVNIKLKRWNEAERVFRAQDKKRSTKDTRFGIGAVSNSKYGMWPDRRNDCTVRWKC